MYLETYWESYISIFLEIMSILWLNSLDDIFHILPHINRLDFNYRSFIFFIQMPDGVLWRQNSLSYFWYELCLMNPGNITLGYLIKENWLSYTWLLCLLIIYGCFFVRLSWIEMNMPDRTVDDEWIKTSILEYIYLVFSLINMNSEASYQTWSML